MNVARNIRALRASVCIDIIISNLIVVFLIIYEEIVICGIFFLAAIAWHESRREWIGDSSKRLQRTPKDPVIR